MPRPRSRGRANAACANHLQFAVLDALGVPERTGRELRKALADRRVRKSGPAFYQLMSRREDVKFVRGRYTQKIVDGRIIKQRRY